MLLLSLPRCDGPCCWWQCDKVMHYFAAHFVASWAGYVLRQIDDWWWLRILVWVFVGGVMVELAQKAYLRTHFCKRDLVANMLGAVSGLMLWVTV